MAARHKHRLQCQTINKQNKLPCKASGAAWIVTAVPSASVQLPAVVSGVLEESNTTPLASKILITTPAAGGVFGEAV